MSEERPEPYYVRRREFLNEDPDLPAFIIGIVEDTRAVPDDNDSWGNGEIVLDFADCYRRVSFYFNMCNLTERANSLRKINLIAEVVNAVRDGIALEVESRNARPVPQSADSKAPPATPEVEKVESAGLPAKTGNQHFFTDYVTTLGL